MTPAHGKLRVFDDAEALARGAADWLCGLAEASTGRFTLSLSGGSTPKRLYELLAETPLRDRMPWDRTVWTFGDERFVPPDDKDSNQHMVRQALLDHVPVPAGQVHAFRTTGCTPEESAAEYEAVLRGLSGPLEQPLFDLTLLGLGEDGHTASLIPGEPVTAERTRWVAAVPHGRDNVRLTLTFPVLERSRRVAFLVSGAKKRDVLDRVLSGDAALPAGQVRPQGELLWLADRDAAGRWAE